MANPFVHIELNSNDIAKARPFYAGLFGWELNDMDMGPMGTYTTIGVGEDGTGGGMMQHPVPDAESVWVPYVLVDDLAASTEKARSLGGTVVQAMVPVAEMGTFSLVKDPSGAIFGLWETKSQGS
ncbi:MAG TPA: VOC family protein [Candidatus Limnocylindrales bacterium]|nr:VOC family protein [Candidatus Limnocylindrales bacterium]